MIKGSFRPKFKRGEDTLQNKSKRKFQVNLTQLIPVMFLTAFAAAFLFAKPDFGYGAEPSSPSSSSRIEDSTRAAYEKCNMPYPGTPSAKVLRKLKKIVLYIAVPREVEDAVSCHGREKECAKGSSHPDEYIQNLKNLYQNYPPPIRLSNLVEKFKIAAQKQLHPFVVPDDKCQVSDVVVLRDSAGEDYDKLKELSAVPDTITVFVRLNIATSVKPVFGLLAWNLLRPNLLPEDWRQINFHRTGLLIPFDRSDSEMEKIVAGAISFSDIAMVQEGFVP